MPWELDYEFKQTNLAVRTANLRDRDSFCCALVVGWLTETSEYPFRSMAKYPTPGLNRETTQLYKAQLNLRAAFAAGEEEAGTSALLQSRGLVKGTTRPSVAGGDFTSDLAATISKLHASRMLIQVQGPKGTHAFGLRIKPGRTEFFDPNWGVYCGDDADFYDFLVTHFRRKPYETGGFSVAFVVTTVVTA